MVNLIKSKILNLAWKGQGDFGDEVMAYTLRKFLQNQGVKAITYYHHGKFPSYRSNDDLAISYLHSFEASGWKKKLVDKFLLRQFKVVIMGGGSIFHSSNSIVWKLEILKKIKKYKNFAAALGVSLGSFNSESGKKLCTELIKELNFLVARDNYSANLAKELSSDGKIYSSLDSSLMLPKLCPDQMPKPLNQKEDLIGVMFVKNKRLQKEFAENKNFDKYLAILNDILKRGKMVILFNLYVGDGYLDQKLNQELKRFQEWMKR